VAHNNSNNKWKKGVSAWRAAKIRQASMKKKMKEMAWREKSKTRRKRRKQIMAKAAWRHQPGIGNAA
jgi:hypothetical protein